MAEFDSVIAADFFELRSPLDQAFGGGFEWAALSERRAFIMYERFVFAMDWTDSSRRALELRILLPADASVVDFAGQETREIPNSSAGISRVVGAVRAYCDLHIEARVRALYGN